MKQMKKELREVSVARCVGFGDAVADLGTHTVCGNDIPYSRTQVYKVLQGKAKSMKLLKRIAARRPDLFGLRFVAADVKSWYSDWQVNA